MTNKKFKKSHKRKFVIKYYNKEFYDFDYLKKLSKKDKIYLQKFFDEEYANQREKKEYSVYYSKTAYQIMKQNKEEYKQFLSDYYKYVAEKNINKRKKQKISHLNFFVIYCQRIRGKSFYAKNVDIMTHFRDDVKEITFEEMCTLTPSKNEMTDEEHFLRRYRDRQLDLYLTEKIIELIDELRPSKFNLTIDNINLSYKMYKENKGLKSKYYQYLYRIFAFFKVNNKNILIKQIDNVFKTCIYSTQISVMRKTLEE